MVNGNETDIECLDTPLWGCKDENKFYIPEEGDTSQYIFTFQKRAAPVISPVAVLGQLCPKPEY